MIYELIKKIMVEHKLKQADLAEVLDCSLSRVKAITSGRVKNLTRTESELLISKLGIRADWLLTGQGLMTTAADVQHMRGGLAGRLQQVGGGDDTSSEALMRFIEQNPNVDMGWLLTGEKHDIGELNHIEKILVANHRNSPENGRQAVQMLAAFFAQSSPIRPKK